MQYPARTHLIAVIPRPIANRGNIARRPRRAGQDLRRVSHLRARPEITESTFDRVRYGFTTFLGYHML